MKEDDNMSHRRSDRMSGQYTFEQVVVDNKIVSQTCVFCGKMLPISNFACNGKNAMGEPVYRHDCKTCYNIRRKENNSKKAYSDFIGGQKRRGEANPDFTHQEWKEVVIFFGGECAYCGCTPRKGQRLTKDHLEPIAKGGMTTADNIVPACGCCNSSKGADDFKDWFMKQPFFSQERLNKIFKWRTMMRLVGTK